MGKQSFIKFHQWPTAHDFAEATINYEQKRFMAGWEWCLLFTDARWTERQHDERTARRHLAMVNHAAKFLVQHGEERILELIEFRRQAWLRWMERHKRGFTRRST